MRVRLINNNGGGFAQDIEITEGMAISQFMLTHLGDSAPNDLKIRVNREAVSADYVLKAGDIVSATPRKIDSGN